MTEILKSLQIFSSRFAGCSADKPGTQVKFKKKHRLNLCLLTETGKTMLKDYSVWQQKRIPGEEIVGHGAQYLISSSRTIRSGRFSLRSSPASMPLK